MSTEWTQREVDLAVGILALVDPEWGVGNQLTAEARTVLAKARATVAADSQIARAAS